MKKYCKTKTRK